MKKVYLNEVVKELNLQVIWGNELLKREVIKPMTSRPCVEIYAGYFDYFEKDRLQIIGSKELAILNLLDEKTKKTRLQQLFSFNSPAFIFTKNADVSKDIVEIAIEKKMPILKSNLTTSALIGNLYAYMSNRLAKRQHVDGVMLDVYGVGVLIQGVDGIGKSETALELLKHGHLLVSDCETNIYQREPGMLIGECSEVYQKLIDIKDIGVIDVVNLFGIGAFKKSKRLMLVIELIKDENEKKTQTEIKFFDTSIPYMSILVESGRNMASLIEMAAMNHQLHMTGLNGDVELKKRKANEVIRRGN